LYDDFLNLYGGGQVNSIFTTGITLRAVSQEKLAENSGTEGAPRGHGLSLKLAWVQKSLKIPSGLWQRVAAAVKPADP
jgi:hypothetical protein